MATRIWETQITVPAGTPIASPVSQSWVTEDALINDIEIEIPPGHNGQTGIEILKGGSPLIPYSAGTWIIANNYSRQFPVNDYVPTADLTIVAYNTGQYPHTFYLRMTVTEYDSTAGGAASALNVPLPIGQDIVSSDPLSPAAILGPDVANALTTGDLTADDVAPVVSVPVNLPPEPVPTGL